MGESIEKSGSRLVGKIIAVAMIIILPLIITLIIVTQRRSVRTSSYPRAEICIRSQNKSNFIFGLS